MREKEINNFRLDAIIVVDIAVVVVFSENVVVVVVVVFGVNNIRFCLETNPFHREKKLLLASNQDRKKN